MGRPKLPTNVLDARGAFKKNPQRRPKDEPSAAAAGPLGDPPDHFTPKQIDCWNYIVSKCHEGVLTDADSIALEMAAVLLDQFRTYPLDVPAARIIRLDSLLSRFGMTPADRSKVKVPQGGDGGKPGNPFAGVLKPKRGA